MFNYCDHPVDITIFLLRPQQFCLHSPNHFLRMMPDKSVREIVFRLHRERSRTEEDSQRDVTNLPKAVSEVRTRQTSTAYGLPTGPHLPATTGSCSCNTHDCKCISTVKAQKEKQNPTTQLSFLHVWGRPEAEKHIAAFSIWSCRDGVAKYFPTQPKKGTSTFRTRAV